MEENEDDTISFLMLENQVKRQQAQRPEEYLLNLINSHQQNRAASNYTQSQVAEAMQKLGMILDKASTSHEFWLLNFEQIISFILVVLDQATN